MLEKISQKLGLHQRLNMIYVVTGFEVWLENEQEQTIEVGFGETIIAALEDLDQKL